jgi:hypothetical protein
MPDLPRAGCATYLASLSTVPGLRDWVAQAATSNCATSRRLARFRTAPGVTSPRGPRQTSPAMPVASACTAPSGASRSTSPIPTCAPSCRTGCSARWMPGPHPGAKGGGHMVVHFPLHHLVRLQPRHRDGRSGGHHARTLETMAPVVARAETLGITLVVENCEDRDPQERVDLVRAFASPAVAVSLDTGHAHYAHGSTAAPPVDTHVRAAGPLLAHVHLQEPMAWPTGIGRFGQGHDPLARAVPGAGRTAADAPPHHRDGASRRHPRLGPVSRGRAAGRLNDRPIPAARPRPLPAGPQENAHVTASMARPSVSATAESGVRYKCDLRQPAVKLADKPDMGHQRRDIRIAWKRAASPEAPVPHDPLPHGPPAPCAVGQYRPPRSPHADAGRG